jgi:hypothetical protein
MNDVKSVLRSYGAKPTTHMEDYAGHLYLQKMRDKAFRESELWKHVFGDIDKLREACQTLQAEAVQWHTEAMRSNPACGGYNYVQVFDSNAFEIDGLVDFWRNKRKKAFYAMQEVNKPVLLTIRCSPMNVRSGGEVEVRISLVNEGAVSGQKALTVEMKSPSGERVFRAERPIEARPWVTVLFQERVKAAGPTGRYLVEAILWEGATPLVRKVDHCLVYRTEDLRWPSREVVVFDVNQQLAPFLRERGIPYEQLGRELEEARVILVTPFAALWRQPERFGKFIRLFSWVARGCAVVFLGLPEDGKSLVTAADINAFNMLTPLAAATIFPFHEVDAATETQQGQRMGPYSWGQTQIMGGSPIPAHRIFEGVGGIGLIGRDYGNVVPVQKITADWITSQDTGSAVQIYEYTKGKIILTTLNLLPNLHRDALAEKLLANIVNYADLGLPAKLAPDQMRYAESDNFEEQGYHDCFRKYIEKSDDLWRP